MRYFPKLLDLRRVLDHAGVGVSKEEKNRITHMLLRSEAFFTRERYQVCKFFSVPEPILQRRPGPAVATCQLVR